jgi:hypothetical protein
MVWSGFPYIARQSPNRDGTPYAPPVDALSSSVNRIHGTVATYLKYLFFVDLLKKRSKRIAVATKYYVLSIQIPTPFIFVSFSNIEHFLALKIAEILPDWILINQSIIPSINQSTRLTTVNYCNYCF